MLFDRKQLRAMRLEAGLTSKNMANRLGISPQTLSRYENGHTPIPPSIEYAVRWLCQTSATPKPADQLIDSLRRVVRETVDGG